jgi:HAD superfamily hydrolase (TIGR01458 family)
VSGSIGSVEALLVDLDGVLYVSDDPVAGAREAVSELRDRGLALRFVTNTTARSRTQTLAKLDRLGFDVAARELVTPAALARRYCERAGHHRVALVMNEEVKADFAGLEETSEDPDAVIMGDLGEAFGFAILNRAFRMVIEGAELIALQKNRYWLTSSGLALDAGPFVAAIEYATGTEAIVVGKPSASFFELVLEDLATTPERALMIGDDVESDIGGGLAAGLRAVLVRTGKYREDFVAGSGIEPTATIDSIADLPTLLEL